MTRKATAMATADDVRRLALVLPHVEEVDSDGFDFRVAGKRVRLVLSRAQGGQARLIRTDIAVLYVGDEAEKQALLRGEPECSSPLRSTTAGRWSCCRLAAVGTERLAELVTDAWRMRAPERLTASQDHELARQLN